jgi:hypothetical protein
MVIEILIKLVFWIYDLKKETWEKLFTISEPFQKDYPTPRGHGNFVYDKKNQMHYIFG